MATKRTYTITTSDGKSHEVSEENINKYGIGAYADSYKDATIRMRDKDGADYDIPLGYYDNAVSSGLSAYITEHSLPAAPGTAAQGSQQTMQAETPAAHTDIKGTPSASATGNAPATPQQTAWKPTEQEKIRISYGFNSMLGDFNRRSKARVESARRVTDGLSAEGRTRRKAGKFVAQIAGTPTEAMGLSPDVSVKSADDNAQSSGNVTAGEESRPLLSGEGPVPYGVVTGEDGKRMTQWLLPDGTLTTDFGEADKAAYGARRVRLMNRFVGRMRKNGLDPGNEDDVRRQASLDAQAPMRKVLAGVWADAEAEDKAADEAYAMESAEYDKSIRGNMHAIGPDGLPLSTAEENLRDYQRIKQHKETFNLEAIAQKTYEGLPKTYRDIQLRAYQEYFKTHTDELDGRTPAAAAQDALKGEVYNAVYQHAVESRMPQNKTEFFMRKLADQPFLSTYQAMDMGASALTGSWGMSIADQAAMARYGQEHRGLDIAGTVVNMAIDPTTYMAGGIGSLVGKQALRMTGRQMLKGATKEMAERYAAGTLTGRLVQGVAGGAANFAAFETAKNLQQQASTGGVPDYETGTSEGFSGQEVLNAAKHGFVMGGATGALSPLIGNVADKAVKATSTTAGKAGVRGAELAVSTLAEGTVFSIPEWIEGDRDAMDVWTDNLAMMLGFKASHAVKTAPSVIRSLRPARPEGRPLTREERIHNNKSFNERVRDRLNASPSDIGLTAEERDELKRRGYGDLSDLFNYDPEYRSRKAETAQPVEGDAKVITGLSARVDYEPRAEESGNRDFDGYEAMERLMEDSNVSEATRAKAYYILTGRMLPMSTVTGWHMEKVWDEGPDADKEPDGYVVSSYNQQNGVVTRRTFKTEKAAEDEVKRIERQVELNTIDVGEQYRRAEAQERVMEAAIYEVSPGADAETVYKIYQAVRRGNNSVTEEQRYMADLIDEAIERNSMAGDEVSPEGIRRRISEDTGIDIDKAIRKEPGKRSEEENAAVKRYARALFPEEETREERPEQEEADRIYGESRQLYGRFEQGDPDAQAEMDAISLRMREATELCEDVFGDEAEVYMAKMQEDPWGLMDESVLTADQKDAVLYYINARSALEGVLDASNEAAMEKRDKVKAEIDHRTHRERGMIVTATLSYGDKPVYIISGDVVMFPDGSMVDESKSSREIIILDESGEYKFAAPGEIKSVDETIDPQTELQAAWDAIDAEQAAAVGAATGEDESTEDLSSEVRPADTAEYDRGYEEGIASTDYTDEELAGAIEASRSYLNEGRLDDFGRGRLEGLEYEQQRRAQSVPETSESVPNPAENPVADAETAPEMYPSAEDGQQTAPQTALARIPLNEQGEPNFESVDRETAWDGLVEAAGGEDDALEIALAQAEQATADLEALNKKPPTMKAPKLKGSPMAMAEAKRKAAEQYQNDLAQYNQQIADAQARIDIWNGIVGVHNSRTAELRSQQEEERRQRDAIAHDEAVARFEEEQRIKAEKQAEQERIGVHAVNPRIEDKWNAAPKVEGNADAITLPDGSTLTGRYVLTEAGAASPSHDVNNAYQPTEGFPIDENGQSVNDRDYMRDKDAQQIVEGMASSYDNRALQDPVIVSRDGIVLSGNNRTMSGDLAAGRGTDKAYVDYLAQFGHKKFGFTPEQVSGIKNPRVVFVPNEDLSYDAATFARFNAQEKKSQGKPEAAVKLGKIVSDNVFNNIVNDISRYDRLSDYYADERAAAQALSALMQAGVINDKQLPEMRTGTALSAPGKELIENTLIGKVFQASPDAVRQIISVPTLRQSIVMGLNEIANNRTLVRNGYDITDELAKAVDLVSRAKAALPEVFTDGMPVSPFGRMQGLFDDEFGDSRVSDATTLLLADLLNSGRPSDLRKILTAYNNEASQASGGQMDMFTGSIPTKEEILTTVNEHFRNATPKEQQALVEAAIAERKRRAEADAEQRERSEASEQTPDDDERREEPQQPTAGDTEFTELEALGKGRNDPNEDTPEEAALRARISVGEEWEEAGPAPDKPIYKRKLYVDGKHEVIQTDAPDKNGSYTGSQLTYEGRDYGDLKELADHIDGKTTCPVCGKTHIPNYKEQDVVCPQCNTDLSVFRQIDQLSDEEAAEVLANIERMQSEPTEAQKAAGNYKMGHRRVDGYNISIENAKGSVRRGTGADGKAWETTMQNDYGYIRGTEGVDGDHIDVFLSDTPEEGDVFVVDQVKEDGSFDEHKVMYGFATEQAARDAYLSNYEPGWTGLGAITHVSKDEFKKWIQSSRRKTKPFAEYESVKAIEGNGMIGRSLTEQESTDLIERMGTTAEVAPETELTPENWLSQFGEAGTVETPMGIVKMGANQLLKLYSTKRTGYFGMIHPTLSTPDVILEEADPEEGSERDSKYLFVKTFIKSDGSRVVHFESVTVKKEGMEVSISSHEIKDKSLKNKMQNDIVLHLDEKLSPSSEMRLTETPKESEGPDLVPTSDNVVSSDSKDNTLLSDKQADEAESSEPYTITATTYTNKRGKTSEVHLVKFNRELTAEEKAALDTFAREPLSDGKKTSRGWYDRKEGGYMMRSEEAARQLAGMIGSEEAIADAQPMTAKELREATSTAVSARKERPGKAKKEAINRVSLEDVMTDLSTKGETRLSDHAEPISPGDKPADAEPEQQHEISDEEMASLADELRDLLGIGDDEGNTDIRFRDPGELTAQERQRIQSAGIRLAMGLIERGTTAFPDYAAKMVGLLGNKIRPWLKSFYEGARWTPGYEIYEFTPSDEVSKFDTENFDKATYDALRDAAMIVEERKASAAGAQAERELKEIRNKQRREDEKQRDADTAAIAEEAGAVAGEAKASGGTKDRRAIGEAEEKIERSLDRINEQLAILGYFERKGEDPSAIVEKKAAAAGADLASRLIDDLGLELGSLPNDMQAVSADFAERGGLIRINLPIRAGYEPLRIEIGLERTESGSLRLYSLRTTMKRGDALSYIVGEDHVEWLTAPRYGTLLDSIREQIGKYLPKDEDNTADDAHGESERDEVPAHWKEKTIEELEGMLTELQPKAKGATAKSFGVDRIARRLEEYISRRKKEAAAEKEAATEKAVDILNGGKNRKSGKKTLTLKADEPLGGLFAEIFDEPETAKANEKREDNKRSQGVAGASLPHSVGSDEAGTDGRVQAGGTGTAGGNGAAHGAGSGMERGADGATHGADEERGLQPRVGDRGRDEGDADSGSADTGVERGGTAGAGSIPERETDRGAEGVSAGEPSAGTGGGSGSSALKKSKKPEARYTRNFRYDEENGNEADTYTPSQRLEANVKAIETLADVLFGNTPATDEQKAIMSRFRGWGQVDLGKYYDIDHILRNTYENAPINRLARVIKRLDPTGDKKLFEAIKRASLSSYYTPTPIARAMNSFLALAGYKGGSMLDPSMGNGMFEGTLPKSIQERTSITGVELDWLSGQLSRALYPDANVMISAFEKSGIAPGSFDIVTSNVPFGDIAVNDPTWKNDGSPLKRSAQNRIHNYYAVKMLEATRPGGLVAMMTTSAVMDTQSNQNIRAHIADQGEILGAIRLPDNTFQGTGVVTDIILVRKWRDEQDREQTRAEESYMETERAFLSQYEKSVPNKLDGSKQQVSFNCYYKLNPRNLIGEIQAGNQYGKKDAFGLTSKMTVEEIASEVEKSIKRIVGSRRGSIFNPRRTIREAQQAVREEYKGNGDWVSNGNLVIQDGKVGVLTSKSNEYGEVTRTFEGTLTHDRMLPRIEAMTEVRTSMKKLIAAQIEGGEEKTLAALRDELQKAYDRFVGKYGRLQDRENAFILDDIDGYTLQALEVWKNGKFTGLSDIFTKNSIKPALKLEGKKTPQEAVALSLAEYGYLRPDYLARALGEDWAEQCGDFVYLKPNSDDDYATRDEYLSGDVVTKLADARAAAEKDQSFERNVKALEEVQPTRIPFDDIAIHLGARWIPEDILNDFVNEIFGIHAVYSNRNRRWDAEKKTYVNDQKSGVRYIPETDSFEINIEKKELGGEAQEWETPKKSAKEILQAALEDKTMLIKYKDKEGNEHVDEEQTELANQKIADLRERFESWLPGDPERVEVLEQTYNDRFNRTVIRHFDGSHLVVPGLMGKELRPHQKDAVWMLINNRGGIVDHIVGAGKTLVMQAAIMEMRRMGIAKKPLIVALKSTVSQIARDFKESFPLARVLAPNDNDFTKENRKKFIANISLNDYDCIILSHEQYCKLPHTEEAERSVIDEQLWQLNNMIEYLYGTSDQSQMTKRQIKALEKRRNNLVAALEKRLDRNVDREFCFENLGIDYMFVDESHQFKSLPYVTSYQKVAGLGDAQGSSRAVALLTGIRHLQRMHQGDKGTVFLSGTTITNSLVEIYNLLNYLRPRKLEALGMPTFDAWASVFAVHSAELEAGVTGNFGMKDRFRSFDNVPELSQLYAEIADVRNDTNLKLPKPAVDGRTVIVPASEAMQEINSEIVNMLESKDGSYFGLAPKDPKRAPWGLHASTLSAKAAVSPRLIFPDMEDDGGKVHAVCENVKKYYDEQAEQRGVQLIFCEMGVPDKSKKYDAYTDMVNRFVNDYGIPRTEIAYIQEANTEEKRKDLFQRVRDGKVRILIGGTKNMGTGVNVQDRITDMHMLTVPWTPSALEQCIGRGARQGNLVARDFMDNKVRVHYYATEGSLDLYKYQLLDAKGKMFTQFKMGTVNGGRSFDEGSADEDGNIDPAEMVAILSGNPVIFERAKQDKVVKKLRALRNGFERDYQRKKAKYMELEARQERLERLVKLNERDQAELAREGFRADEKGIYPTNVTIMEGYSRYGGRTFDKPKEAGEYLLKMLDDGKEVTLQGFGQRAKVMTVNEEGSGGLFSSYRMLQIGDGEYDIKYTVRLSDDATAAGTAFRNLLKRIIDNGAVFKRDLEETKNQLKGMNIGDGVFPKQAELDAAIAKYKELNAEYNKLGKKPEVPTSGDGNKYRLVADGELLDFLDAQPLKKGYRYSQWANMGVLPPMTAKQNGEWRAPMIFSRWEQSEEGMRKENGKADLVQGNGRTTGDVAYNPYFHIRTSPLNDQFTAAYDRPELLVVEGYYPESEETSGYQAEGAKDSVGLMDWHSGSVNGQLSDDTKVQTMLSRYFKPGRIVPWSEVADLIMERVGDQKITFPINAVPPMLRAELAKRGAKFGDISGSVAEADIPMLNELRDRVNAGEWDAGLEKARAYLDAYESSTEAKEGRVKELAMKLNTPVRIIRDESEIKTLPSRRKRRAKGWWSSSTGEVVVVLPNNVNVADVENTLVHEVVGHKGLRAFIGEDRFEEFLGEVYEHASKAIKGKIDKETERLVNEEADRLRERKRKAHERAGEDYNATYYTDMAEARVEAEQKRESFRKEATEEYMADLGGRIGDKGFEKMSRDELTLWGKIKAKVQAFLDRFLRGLRIAKGIRLTDKDLSYILFKSWRNLRETQTGKAGGVVAEAEDAVRRMESGYDADEATRFRDGDMGLEEAITKLKSEALASAAASAQEKRAAMRAIGGNLNHLRQAMARQREYDITTVKSVADLVQVLMDRGLLDDLSKLETKRILSAINNVVGKQDVSQYVQKVMDIMVDNQLRMGANAYGDLLSMKGSRVDARGIEVQGALDPDGQKIAQTVRRAMTRTRDDIERMMADAMNRMSSADQALADDAALEYAGLQLAHLYTEEIRESKAEERDLSASIKEAQEEYKQGNMTHKAYLQYKKATEDAIRQNKIERAEAYWSLAEQLGGVLGESVVCAKAWREAEKQRVEEIHHNANSDMEGRPADEHHKDNRIQKLANNDLIRFLLSPLATFDQMLRMLGKKNSRGEGYLWNRYMRDWVKATEKEYTGYRDALKVLDAKVSEIYGKDMTWGDLFSIWKSRCRLTPLGGKKLTPSSK